MLSTEENSLGGVKLGIYTGLQCIRYRQVSSDYTRWALRHETCLEREVCSMTSARP